MPATPQTVHGAAARSMSPGVVVVVLALLLGIQPVSTDLYLPALPALTEGFADAGAASALNGFLMTFAAFMAGNWVGTTRLDRSAGALTQGVRFWSACIALVAWTLVPRYGELRRT